MAEVMLSLTGYGYDAAFLSNFSQPTFKDVAGRFSFLKRPRGATISGEIRLINPDPKIYELHSKTHDLASESILLIDDSPAKR
ncbi:MAG: hypothetical protein AAF468_09530 [Pseudomonadota bacterium]